MYQSQPAAKKLLLVDDEPDILEFLSYNFRKEGFEVYTAYDGKQGIELVQETHPDVVITDILMPHMNGIAMCQQIKAQEEHKGVPIIFLSASNDDLFAIAAMKAGGSRYISKPIRFHSLNQMVKEILEQPSDGMFKRRYKAD